MIYYYDILLQIGLTPSYTKHPMFPDMFSAMIVATLISVALTFAFAILRKKTTDIGKMQRVMRETNEWRKQYTDAVKKRDKARIDELKKQQAHVNRQSMEIQQKQMRPMMIYMIPSFLLWIFVFPQIFGATVAVSPVFFPYISCDDNSVNHDNPAGVSNGERGACTVPGEMYLWGWFLITSFGFSGIVSKVTKTNMPSIA
jgi:uncharacterized membrane protein (DUF106 family)